jgi:UDP-3-O-[3-hydroxymyristoyl] N-acetylglucosamine deacetylase
MKNISDKIHDSYYQHTLREKITFSGQGFLSGLRLIMSIMPAEPNTGYVFTRRDVDSDKENVQACWYNVTDTYLSTTITNNRGTSVSMIVHLLAALHTCGIDNARIVLDAPEVPVMDGSAAPYVSLIRRIGRIKQSEERRAIVITKPVCIKEKDKSAQLIPSNIFNIDMKIYFNKPFVGSKSMSIVVNEENFCKVIAPARTCGFDEQSDTFIIAGLAKGESAKDDILEKKEKVINEDSLRYHDEIIRHKILDCIGDLTLAGAHIVGEFVGNNSGRQLNIALLRELMLNEDSWQYTTLRDASENWSSILLWNTE